MTDSSPEPRPVGDLTHRTLRKIGEIDPQSFEPNNKKEMDLRSWKKQKSEKWQVYLDSNTGHLRHLKLR